MRLFSKRRSGDEREEANEPGKTAVSPGPAEKHRQAAQEQLAGFLAAVERLRRHADISTAFIQEQGRGYMGAVDLSWNPDGQVTGWFIRSARMPINQEPPVLDSERLSPTTPVKTCTACVAVTLSGEVRVLPGDAAKHLARPNRAGEHTVHVSVAAYAEGARWVLHEGGALHVESADYSLRGLKQAILEHLSETDAAEAARRTTDQELAGYEATIARLGHTTDPELHTELAEALVCKGFRLVNALKRPEDGLAVYDDVITRFQDAKDAALREWALKARINKGFALARLGRTDEAAQIYDDIVARYGHEPDRHEYVAKALINKGCMLGDAGRYVDAASAFDQVIARFGDTTDPALDEVVKQARNLSDMAEGLNSKA